MDALLLLLLPTLAETIEDEVLLSFRDTPRFCDFVVPVVPVVVLSPPPPPAPISVLLLLLLIYFRFVAVILDTLLLLLLLRLLRFVPLDFWSSGG